MIVTQEIARIAQALLKDSTASLVEATWQSLTPLKLTPGQTVQGEVLASLPQSRFLVRVANELLKMELPLNLQPGQAVELTYVTDEPRLLFALSKTANSGVPVQISDTGRWLNSLAQEAKTPPAASPLPRPALILPGPPRDPAILADGLRNALTKSGVFYESHLADWLRGERPLADILREPQGSLSRLAASLAPDTGSAAPAQTGGQLPGQASAQTQHQAQAPTPGPPETVARPPAQTAGTAAPDGTGEPAAPGGSAPSAASPREAALPGGPPSGAVPLPRDGETRPPPSAAQNPPPPAAGTADREAPLPSQTSGGAGAASRPPADVPAPAAHSSSSPASPTAPEPAAQRPAETVSQAVPQGKTPEPQPLLTRPPPSATAPAPETAVRQEPPPPAGPSPSPAKAEAPLPRPESPAVAADPRPLSPETREVRIAHQPDGARPAVPERPSPAPAPLPAETVPAPSGSRAEAAMVDRGTLPRPAGLPPQGGVEPQTIPIIKEQLTALTSGSFTWLGQVWPGQDMEWTVQERGAEGRGEGRKWQTELRIEFPRLGKVRATLMLAGEGVAVNLVAADEETAATLAKGSERLAENMEGAGIRLSGLAVRHGGE